MPKLMFTEIATTAGYRLSITGLWSHNSGHCPLSHTPNHSLDISKQTKYEKYYMHEDKSLFENLRRNP